VDDNDECRASYKVINSLTMCLGPMSQESVYNVIYNQIIYMRIYD